MSTCPQCFVGLCKRHPLQDSGLRKSSLLAKEKSLTKLHDTMVKEQLNRMKGLFGAAGTSQQEQQSYRDDMDQERRRAEARPEKEMTREEKRLAKTALNGHTLHMMARDAGGADGDREARRERKAARKKDKKREKKERKRERKERKREKKERKHKKSRSRTPPRRDGAEAEDPGRAEDEEEAARQKRRRRSPSASSSEESSDSEGEGAHSPAGSNGSNDRGGAAADDGPTNGHANGSTNDARHGSDEDNQHRHKIRRGEDPSANGHTPPPATMAAAAAET